MEYKVSTLPKNDYNKKPSVPEDSYKKELSVSKDNDYKVPTVPKEEYKVPSLPKNDYYKKPSAPKDNYKKVSFVPFVPDVPSVPKQEYKVPSLPKSDYYQKPSLLEDNYKKIRTRKCHLFQRYPQYLNKNTRCLICQRMTITRKKLVLEDNYKKVLSALEVPLVSKQEYKVHSFSKNDYFKKPSPSPSPPLLPITTTSIL
ncbi:hypothetical protein H5410_061268 [Solanum commersonii]|uniref:Uncharacterized protein n=1 Tax=Solanum commersonii TaxID=4109 RepID=A0A9J5W942_SOLCO|nr:hypothetical protein H5410_061268 [Solanum commersonii]